MAHVSYLDTDDPDAGDLLSAIRERIEATAGAKMGDVRVPNSLAALAHSPRLLEVQMQLLDALWNGTQIERSLQELVILRVAQVRQSDYEWGRHVRTARLIGVPEAKIDALERFQESPDLTDAERAAIGLVDALARDGDATQSAIDAVLEHFSQRQLVELTELAGAYVMFAIFLKGLKIDQEPDDPRLPVKRPTDG
jgi:alkylhydroperoxidase family enzyme